MPLGKRQLFIYWRIAAADLPAALDALRGWQSDLLGRQPALRCGVYQRTGSGESELTVMESYALESALPHLGIDDTLHRFIDQAGQALLQPWLIGARHVEVFDALNA